MLLRLHEASWSRVLGSMMTAGLKSDAMKEQDWKNWKKNLKNGKKRETMGLKLQKENKMPFLQTSNSSANATLF